MAAADCAQYGEPAPPELRLAWRIQQWGPPNSDGWGEWPAGQIDRLSAVLNVYNAMAAYAGNASADWLDRHPQQAAVVGQVLRWRMGIDD